MQEIKNSNPDGMKTLKNMDDGFTTLVKSLSEVNLHRCWHCLSCSGGCPFVDAMDYRPNEILRLVQLGMKKEALNASSIWFCVGCHTCSVNCPQAIDMAAVMDALRQTAIKENIPIPEPDVFNFHKEVLNSIERYGRTHKIEIMLRYKLQKKNWFSDMDVGLKMLAKRKLDLMPSKINKVKEVKHLYQQFKHEEKCNPVKA